MKPSATELRNRWLTARFDPATGLLNHLSSARDEASLIASASLGYFNNGEAFPPASSMGAQGWRVETVTATPTRLLWHLISPDLLVTQAVELKSDSPVMNLSLEVRGRPGAAGPLACPGGLLRFDLSGGFNDVFEDEEDLYFDGAELGGGRQLRPWRVFFREGRREGLFVGTPSKAGMGHLSIGTRCVGLYPHAATNYLTTPTPPMALRRGQCWRVALSFGPWRRDQHRKLLVGAGIPRPVRIHEPPLSGKARPTRPPGKLFHLADLVPKRAVALTPHPRKWMAVKLPFAWRGRALMSNPGVRPPAITLRPKLCGLYRVFVGVAHGKGASLRLSGDPETSIRMAPAWRGEPWYQGPFVSFLSGRHRPREVGFGVAELSGRSVTVGAFTSSEDVSILEYIRFEKLSAAAASAWQRRQARKPRIELSGFNDIPDIAMLTDTRDPDPRVYSANIWEHARCGYARVFWRVDGQCADFPSRHVTMRYTSAKVHSLFHPKSKAYGRVLRKVDMLRLATDAARKHDVALWGWMRFNSYMGNVQSDFYKQHPEWWEEWDGGRRGGRLCLAVPEVRRHKINILVEAASYGLAGLQLGFLRHPPVLQYHPLLVEGFQKKYGRLPPRDRATGDPAFINSLPPEDDLHRAWYQHRADYLTLFGRELRAALRRANLGHVQISLWLRPNHCLFDGIDLPAWLDERLCDEAVVNGVIGADFEDEKLYGVRPDWRRMVQSKARLVRSIRYVETIGHFRKHVPGIIADKYDGLCTYESDWAVLDDRYIEAYQRLR